MLEAEGRQVEAEIDEAGGEALFVRLDVTSEANWQEAIAATVERFGKLDILVNNAGIGGLTTRLEDSTLDEWNRVMDINATGVFFGDQDGYPRDATGRRWVDHQHLVYLGQCRSRQRLCRVQRV